MKTCCALVLVIVAAVFAFMAYRFSMGLPPWPKHLGH